MDTQRLLFRRQFIMGPQKITLFPLWNSLELPEKYYISVHPDLAAVKATNKENYLLLLGYILDPQSPNSKNSEIVETILVNSQSIEMLLSKFYRLAGRYACITYVNGKYYFFNDATGFRSIFYYELEEKFWCASQAALLAEFFEMQPDRTIENDLNKLKLFKDGTEFWYPGILSPFDGIKHLLPNHYLDFSKRQQIRYWPDIALEKTSLKESAEKSAILLKQIMESAAARFELDIAITAGLDSRMVMAGCRSISKETQFFTHTHPRLNFNGSDIKVPTIILKNLGLRHLILFHSDRTDPDFESIFKRNVTNGRISKEVNAFTVYKYFNEMKKEKVIVNGVTGEITRNFFYVPPGIPISAELLGILSRMSSSAIALNEFDNWLQDAHDISFKNDIKVLDLFYWEQRIGNWAAMSCSEYDIAFESFSPFSCRLLLTTMLGVESKYRTAPDFMLQKAIIKLLWPELLEYEINPPESLTHALRKSMHNSPIYSIYKTIVLMKCLRSQKREKLKWG